jgi:hypothetical protein
MIRISVSGAWRRIARITRAIFAASLYAGMMINVLEDPESLEYSGQQPVFSVFALIFISFYVFNVSTG